MECKKCGFNNIDEAKFCSECGYRLDGKMNCPSCNQTVSSEAKFCPYCGADLKGQVKKHIDVYKQKRREVSHRMPISKIMDFVKMGALSLSVLFTLIFFLMTGFDMVHKYISDSSVSTNNLFEMLSDLFKFTYGVTERVGAYVYVFQQELIYYILTLVIICAIMILVPLFSGIFIYKLYEKYALNEDNNVDTYGILASITYIAGVFLLLNIRSIHIEHKYYVTLSGATLTGIIFSFVFLIIFSVVSIVNSKIFYRENKNTIICKIQNLGLIIFNVVTLVLVSISGFSLNGKINNTSYNLDASFLSYVRYFANYSEFSDSLSQKYFYFAGFATSFSFLNAFLNILLIISLVVSIIGLFKNVTSLKFNFFNYFSFIAVALSLTRLVISFIAVGFYSTSFKAITDVVVKVNVGTHLVITTCILSIISAALILFQRFNIKNKLN